MEKQSKQICVSVDRLSTLPDDVICHVLSFLPTKFSVATSVLASRWRFLWARVPNLDFSTSQFHSHCIKETFDISDIIYDVMSQHQSPTLNSFSFTHENDDCSDDELEEWIDNVTARNVRKIYILLDHQVSLPPCLFTSETLVDLELRYCSEIPKTGDVRLPSLKKLRLEHVHFESNASLPHLISGCPVLEELIIEIERSDIPLDYCDVSSTTLTRFELSSEFENIFDDYPCEVALDTPALRYLSLYHVVPGNVSDRALTSLNEADVNFNAIMTFRIPLYHRYVFEFVGRLSNVKRLRLSTGLMDVEDSVFSDVSIKFNNLTKLVLDEADWRYVSYFLENADNLEVLVIICIIEESPENWVDPKQVPTCVSSHLRAVNISQFGCAEPDFNFVKYLLWNAKVMKQMAISLPYHRPDLKEKLEEFKKISLSKRGSESTKLTLR